MLKVALTGGIASGKSTVAAMLTELGAHLVDTDVLSREAVAPGSPGLAAIVEAFGPGVLDEDGGLRRRALREIVFSDPQARARLNAIVHPAVYRAVERELERIRRQDPRGVAVVDIPLLYETGADAGYPAVIVVYVPPEVQVERLIQRDQVSRDQALKSLAAQMSLAEKREKAKFVVDNSGPLQETRMQVGAVWSRLCDMAAANFQPKLPAK